MMQLPKVVFGNSALGNLYQALSQEDKNAIVGACLQQVNQPAVFDTAGKYGAGLALEALGTALRHWQVPQEQVLISNKLGWYRIPLKGAEPTFERGVWKDINYDAEQRISYAGILQCFEQGNQLLGNYHAQLVSVHDPDEYLATADTTMERARKLEDIKDAYQALHDLKSQGRVQAIGVGAKNWEVIREITELVSLDWVMIANSMTLHAHPEELGAFIQSLQARGIAVINSAVFNGGFLTGGDYYNYKLVDGSEPAHADLIRWRSHFFAACALHGVDPAHACIQYGLNVPGVSAVAMSTSKAAKVKGNVDMVKNAISPEFWEYLKSKQLIR
ncbi:aldo/keto reductase [Chitinophaga sp. sic0106]|uniref:aldo/keto reductase n=1 Tax=Chitinophaga sp. sic0106 TaxID=2854785 RepID=UPI001C464CF6|nr:aldo/keto reductase [Chitinophaga sp. sic0106]MBV7529629.1 aldo/keto reductase [Chitinophaga sp. sic0106]